MKSSSFGGGVHPRADIEHGKHLTDTKMIVSAEPPTVVVIPLSQHIGAPTLPLVQTGDLVQMGQKIGEAKGFVCAAVHASVSGKVMAVENRPVQSGGVDLCVVIENDKQEQWHESVQKRQEVQNLSAQELLSIVKEAGIVGMGGAAFPTHVKLSPPEDKKIDTLILNGAECEPYLTADHRMMVEKSSEIAQGIQIICKILGVTRAIIGIEVNKPDAIIAIQKAVENMDGIEVRSLEVKYPQGSEKHLIKALIGREVPSGGLPMDVGVVVQNVSTAAAIYDAVAEGKPLIERVVTVTGGGIATPQNLWVKIGTPFILLLEQCGGMTARAEKLISGGPMMGVAQHDTQVPVVKGTSGILVLSADEADKDLEQACIRCGKCVDVCPAGLLPLHIANFSEKGLFETTERYRAMDCIECGCCAYVCPAKRYLTQHIRIAKREVAQMQKKK